jgi:hypothetical protein
LRAVDRFSIEVGEVAGPLRTLPVGRPYSPRPANIVAICGTPGLRGTCREARRCMHSRSYNRWLGDCLDGAALRAPGRRSSRRLRQQRESHGHKLVTGRKRLKRHVFVSPRKTRTGLVARGGIEPPTRGFSERPTTFYLRRITRKTIPGLSLRLRLRRQRSLC